ncbi:Phosphoethanolamine N-methyltransferase 3 [Eumeta japonica]|uniref:phosphoethanolamine N-methyltransferase n=1 Tax=Eumeta variegata TaxID=151549 RepID=A0A4C1SG54_EUMVA|nr:Phosphoethanolamine N-methyltransferase 3 [Eumeta japonica]
MSDSKKLQEFLDNGQYSKHGLEKYEWIFGETFLSTGGMETTVQVLKHIQLGKNPKVLDLGSGLGGHSFLFAEKFGADVTGLDLSANMIAVARKHLENRPHLREKVKFQLEDCTKIDFPENTFDLVYSRDTLIHIRNKGDLFRNIFKWLKPDGYVMFTDYVRGEHEHKYSGEFKEYLKKRDYDMITAIDYKQILQNSGFAEVEVKDWREEFKNALKVELNKLQERREEFLEKFTQDDYDDLESGWLSKIHRAEEGHQRWVLGIARKSKQ